MVYGISGGPIEKFREGWAILPFFGKHGVPHYWTRRDLGKVYRSLCGHEHQLPEHPGILPLQPGVFMIDRCKRCSRAHS